MSGHWEPGTILAERYRIVRVIGEGGMGRVYEAAHTTTRRRVAIKAILPEHAGDPELARGLRREAISVSALEHQHIVQVLDFEVHEGTGFLVMEHLAGESLAERLAKGGRMTEGKALQIAIPIARALVAAHAVGIVHRDLKPSNVFLVTRADLPADHVKLLDFGVAKLLGTSPLTELEGHKTRTGAAVGTILYMAPEQAQGRGDVDARADLYALGRVLFECLTGRAPFEAGNLAHFVAQLLTSDAPRVRALRPDVSAATDALVACCLARDPSARPEGARALLRDLEAAARALGMQDTMPQDTIPRGEGPTPEPVVPARPARRPARRGAALAIGAVLVSGLGVPAAVALYAWGASDARPEPPPPRAAEAPAIASRSPPELTLECPAPGATLYRGERDAGALPVSLTDLGAEPLVVLAPGFQPEVLDPTDLAARRARGETRVVVSLVPAAQPDRAVIVRHARPAVVRVEGRAEILGSAPGLVRVPAGSPPIEIVEDDRVAARHDTSACDPARVCVLPDAASHAGETAPRDASPRRRRRASPSTRGASACPDGEVRDPSSGHCCAVGMVWSHGACRRPLAR